MPADPIFYLESIESFTQNGDTATLQVKYSVTQMRWKDIDVPDCAVSSSDVQPSPLHPDKVYYAYYKMELTKDVILTNTSDGWKVSGGSFIDTILFKESALEDWMYGQDTRYHPITGKDMWNPNTGDETALIIALLALSGLAVAVVPRKRRKTV
jgi:LPXTG-motif cell wall-anchored protein